MKDLEALRDWWMDTASVEFGMVGAKAIEYGATDLADIGHMLARTQGRTVNDEEAAEMGCYFYALGKIGRWTAAMSRGDRVSVDSLIDLGVYVRMAQRIRAVGGWPYDLEPSKEEQTIQEETAISRAHRHEGF